MPRKARVSRELRADLLLSRVFGGVSPPLRPPPTVQKLRGGPDGRLAISLHVFLLADWPRQCSRQGRAGSCAHFVRASLQIPS